MIRVRRDQPALFVSDMHLSDEQPDTARWVLASLRDQVREAAFVFLLGDIFDAWIGDDLIGSPDCEACVREFLAWLGELQSQGKQVFALRGNRDFLLDTPPGRARFHAETGVRLLPDPCLIDLQGTPTVLAHGDTLCTDDTAYQAFRSISRSSAWQDEFLSRPLPLRVAAARAMRQESEQHKRGKTDELMDVNLQAVSRLLREIGSHTLIHGHTHRPACHLLSLEGTPAQRWVLPDWDAAKQRGGALMARNGLLVPVGAWPEPVPLTAPLAAC